MTLFPFLNSGMFLNYGPNYWWYFFCQFAVTGSCLRWTCQFASSWQKGRFVQFIKENFPIILITTSLIDSSMSQEETLVNMIQRKYIIMEWWKSILLEFVFIWVGKWLDFSSSFIGKKSHISVFFKNNLELKY